MIKTQNLAKNFDGIQAVDNLTFSVEPGEVLGFLGPNGAGKSTTIKMMGGMLRPSKGSATILGFDVAQFPLEVKRRIGVLPEEIQLYERLTPLETVHFTGSLYGLAHAEVERRALAKLQAFCVKNATYAIGMATRPQTLYGTPIPPAPSRPG